MPPPYNQSDLTFVMSLRRVRVAVTEAGTLEVVFEEHPGDAAKRLRDYVIKESDKE